MPYINCDGQTYSRYDQSTYVKDCIKAERKERQEAHTLCMATPECKAIQEHRNDVLIGGFSVLGLMILGLMLWGIYEVFKRE